MTPERACAACVQLNTYRTTREAATAIAGVPLCREHLGEATRDGGSPAARIVSSLSQLTLGTHRQ